VIWIALYLIVYYSLIYVGVDIFKYEQWDAKRKAKLDELEKAIEKIDNSE